MSRKIKVKEIVSVEKTVYEYKNHDKALPINKDIDGIRFCIRALNKPLGGDRRPHMIYLYVKGNLMVATNGARLHEYRLKAKIPEGFYSVVKNYKNHVIICHEETVEGIYPRWKSIFPTKKEYTVNMENLRDVIVADDNIYSTLYQLNNMSKCPVNFNYIKDLEEGMVLKYYKESQEMFYFTNYNDTMRAAVMGMLI